MSQGVICAPGSFLEDSALKGSLDCPSLEFEYNDSDHFSAELSELYSYTEEPELALNRRCFEERFRLQGEEARWTSLGSAQHRTHVMRFLEELEVVIREKRLSAARAILYLAQGVFRECEAESDVLHWSRYNCFLLYQMGTFAVFLELLNMEIANSQACSKALRKPALSLADSTELRVFLSVMYLVVENIRQASPEDDTEWTTQREAFRIELALPSNGEEPFSHLLFTMVTKFCSGHSPHFPMKKVLLLLWKVLLFTLGGFSELQTNKDQKRAELGLLPLSEDSIQVMKNMKATAPPSYGIELGEQQKRGRRSRRDSLDLYNEKDPFKSEESTGAEEEENEETENMMDSESDVQERDFMSQPLAALRNHMERVCFPKGLPWAPKVRQKDIEDFLEMSRNKFIGFTLGHDTDTLVGLPRPIHESVKILKQHKYVSVADILIKKEEEMEKCPMSLGEEDVEETAAECLYKAMLVNIPQYMIALLKILLAAAPTSKAKTDSINILADILPEEMPVTVLQSMKLGIDVNRHKEIIVKSVSALLLLLLKHFKLNHIYQFEYVAQHLVFANCIPLILKFFNQNIMSFICAKNSISILEFPTCVVHELPELTAESLMLVVFKSAPILKRALKVKQAMMQLYVLKLLKLQTKYLGRQWRKSNMKTMSAIYQMVRHRMNDDWAYGNDIDARPWDFQAEECTLRGNIESFNSRRYEKNTNWEFAPVDNCLQSVVGQNLELPEDFHYTYELWLEREVFSNPIQWEDLLQYS
ncbi:striatin-interacting protein 2 isoform X3 [Phyllobates terribilis]|uniref:striatin-interacting protein 2 isoform X3 n=1 Tax=Phyllobates terribilis TaxID=111132 RepID=UPI003CCB2823